MKYLTVLGLLLAWVVGAQAQGPGTIIFSGSVCDPITCAPFNVGVQNCNLSAPAFCENFNEGPSVNNGRGGDLNSAAWTASRLSGEIAQSGQGGLNPQLQAPIPACRATFTQTIVYSPWDTLICDPSGSKTAQLMTAASIQNYGTNSYMILQPFDFAGRTGKIDFDVDAVSLPLGGYPEIDITDQPVPAPTFREFNNFEVGSLPQNAIIVKFGNECDNNTSAAPYNVMVYANYVGTILTPTYSFAQGGCVQTSAGQLNHFEIQLSQTQISIYGSDFTPDYVNYPNYKLLYQATISLPFTRGYVHVDARNHATLKYGDGPDAIFHWDNIGFDGPLIPALQAYEIPDNTTVSTFTGDAGDPSTPAINLGYLLLDGTTGPAAGMYNPTTLISSLPFQNVNLSGVASAMLTFNAWFNAIDHVPSMTWGISYSINGGSFTTVYPTAAQIAAMSDNTGGGYQAFFTPVINVPLSDLVQGTNTIQFLPVNAPTDYPPVVTNIILLLSGTSNNCNLQLGGTAIFCEPFDVANSTIPSEPATNALTATGGPSRTGGLDPNVWGVSRAVGSVNFGQSQYDTFASTALIGCSGTTTVATPNDVAVCNSQLREATNDNPQEIFDEGGVTVIAMYPRQPFDFAGRTGTVSFDVSNDGHGNHATWPEFWMTDLPVPAPFLHFNSWISFSPNSFGISFAAQIFANMGDGLCPNSNNSNQNRWTVDHVVVVRNYIYEDDDLGAGTTYGTASDPPLTLNILDCVIAPADGSGIMNHVEIQVTPSEIDVYATDAGVVASPTTLRKIASITNANLTLTRGLVWLEDAHYNADKATTLGEPPDTPSQSQHTFVWDNLAFDGPFPGRDFGFDAQDTLVPYTADGYVAGSVTLGQYANGGSYTSWNVLNVPASPNPAVVRVLFNLFVEQAETGLVPGSITVIVNGNTPIVTSWPYPVGDSDGYDTWRTLSVTVPVGDLVTGTNVVQIGVDNQGVVIANVDIVLAGVPGAVPVLPGNSRTYP